MVLIVSGRCLKISGLIIAVGLTSVVVAVATLPVDTIFFMTCHTLPMPSLPAISLEKVLNYRPALVIAF
jgi:hypothetical protein